MKEINQVFTKYFEERFPFFRFTLPVLMMLYPFILILVPLYMLPKYYPLHVLYLFLMISNLRLLRDIADKNLNVSYLGAFKKLYFANTVGLIIFCSIFSYLERGQIITSLNLNWRSFFFFFSAFSVLVLSWLWYYAIKGLIKSPVLRALTPHLKYPLFLVPPILLNIHESQTGLMMSYMGVLLVHAFIFEVIKNETIRSIKLIRFLIVIYTILTVQSAYMGTHNLYFCFGVLGIGILYFIKAEKLDQVYIFGPTILLGWMTLFLNLITH